MELINSAAEYEYLGRTDITDIKVSGNIRYIQKGAFSGCLELNEIQFEEGVQVIEEGAFFGCRSLKKVYLPDSLTTVGEHAFASCTSLEYVRIPVETDELGKGLFAGCSSLERIDVGDGGLGTASSGKYVSIDGVLFTACEDGSLVLEVFPQGRGGTYKTPANVSAITAGAFRGCKNLDKVIITKNVARIGDRAFAGCPFISVSIENKDIEIGLLPFEEGAKVSLDHKTGKNKYAMYGEVDFEEKLSNIRYIFPVSKTFVVPKEKWSCTDDPDISGSVAVTSYNGEETDITTPARLDDQAVSTIGDYAFSPERGGIDKNRRDVLSRIRSVFLSRSIKKIGQGAFKNCSKLEYVLVPGTCEMIGDRAFSGCVSLTGVTLPQKIDRIGNGLFFGCSALENIELPEEINEIGDLAFSGCGHVTYMQIPEGVKKIGRKAFAGCGYLMYISFPDSLEEVGQDAFRGTMWLNGRPEGVIYAGRCAVGYKGRERNIKIRPGTVSLSPGAFSTNEWIVSAEIADGVRKIGSECFYNCGKLTGVSIPDSVETIGDHAFTGCRMLRKAQIPDGIERISEFTFSSCTGLGEIRLPESLKVIERDAFRMCRNLRSISLPEGLERIDDEAFAGCEGLSEVFIPDSVKDIGERAFAGIPNIVLRIREGSPFEEYCRTSMIRYQSK